MTARKFEMQKLLYDLTRKDGHALDYYENASSSPNFKTGDQVTVVSKGRIGFALTGAISLVQQQIGRLDIQSADEYFMFSDRDADCVPKPRAFIKWQGKFYVIVLSRRVDGGTLLAVKTCQNLEIKDGTEPVPTPVV